MLVEVSVGTDWRLGCRLERGRGREGCGEIQNGERGGHVEETIYDMEQYLGWKERRKTDLATHRSRILDILHI